ncbi:MAG: ACP S-malonyltransferase [Kiritimatiellia bacterium]|nr:ACP S-malonyltransferase [Kiritimatiellia bacterium]
MSRSIALLFPGQGAQFVGMGRDLAESLPECRQIFDRASAALGWDLAQVCFEGPDTELMRSDRAQPAIFAHSLACFEALRRRLPGASWAAAAGLSSGEWTALTASGALDLETTLRVLRVRGQAMQEACERRPGTMLSVIGLPDDKMEELCRKTGAEAANYNSPDQTVLSGSLEAIAAAETLAPELGARKAIRLAVAGAFHSSRMEPAAARLAEELQTVEFQEPAFPVYSNVTGSPHGGPASLCSAMVAQVSSPVQWVRIIRAMREHGITDFIECGPGRVLSGLVKRIDKTAGLHTIQDAAGLETVVSSLQAG